MTAIKLTKKAQNIVNQIMSSDAIEITSTMLGAATP